MSKILGIHQPVEVKNYAINGAFDFWQEKVGTTSTVNASGGVLAYSSDMFQYESGGGTTKNYSLVRSTDVPTFQESGFRSTYSNLFTMITGIASPAAADFLTPYQYRMEGLDYAAIHGKVVTFGFWVKASIAGVYSFALTNQAYTRSYVTTFNVNGSNTWEFKSITLTMDVGGTWVFDNNSSLRVFIGTVSGTTNQAPALNVWQNVGSLAASTGTNWQATSGATLRIAQFSIVEGPLGFGPRGFERAGNTIEQELALCQRYYEKSYDVEILPGAASGNGAEAFVGSTHAASFYRHSPSFKTYKRSSGNVIVYGTSTGTSGVVERDSGVSAPWGSFVVGQKGFTGQGTITNNIEYRYQWIADARL